MPAPGFPTDYLEFDPDPAATGPFATVPVAPTDNELTVRIEHKDVRRGETFRISGKVRAQSHECPSARVDVALRDASGVSTNIQSLAADERGRFDSAVTVPFDLRVGDYQVLVATPGTNQCGAGSSR